MFNAGADQFRTGCFVESLATQTLVIFGIRTRRVPFFSSHPSLPLTLSALGVVTLGALLPATPVARSLGFEPLPLGYFAALVAMVVAHLVLIAVGKWWFYRDRSHAPAGAVRRGPRRDVGDHHRHRRAVYFSTAAPQPRRPARADATARPLPYG